MTNRKLAYIAKDQNPLVLGVTGTVQHACKLMWQTTPMLLKTGRKIDPSRLLTHRFKLDQILDAYDTFGHAPDTHALKVIVEA